MDNINIVEDFLNIFQLLTPKQKTIWRYLQGYAKTYRNVFPSQTKIAKSCKCHRDTVIQAIKRFKKLGWLSVIKRAYTSCVYFMVDVLIPLNTLNPKTFLKKNLPKESDPDPTSNPTVINTNKYNLKNDNVAQAERSVQKLTLKDLSFSQKDMKILTSMDKKNPKAMQMAISDFKSLEKRKKINNVAALITARYQYHSLFDSNNIPCEINNLNISEKDKIILSSYFAQDRKTFLFALEDFKSYNVFRKVNNISAFITSRFKEYQSGEKVIKIDPSTVNKDFVQKIIPKLKNLNGLSIYTLNKYVEISKDSYCKTIEYADRGFVQKLKNLFNHWKIQGAGF